MSSAPAMAEIRIARLHGPVTQLVQDGGCSHRGTTFGGES